jgi:hypothetical protein
VFSEEAATFAGLLVIASKPNWITAHKYVMETGRALTVRPGWVMDLPKSDNGWRRNINRL